MSINAGFSLFKPNPLYRNLREDTAKNDDLPTTATTLPTSEFTLGLPPLDTRPKSVLSFDVDELDELIDSSQDELVQELQREKEELQRLNAELQKDKAELLRQRAGDSELAQLVGELATQKTKLQNQNSELQKQNNALQKKLEEHMQETQRHVEKAQATEEMEALVAQLKARQEELQAQCEAFEQTNEALKSQNDDLRAANELVCRQKDEIMAMQKEQQAQFELMQQQHAQSTVADEVAELLTAMEAEKKAMKKQNTELQDELDEVYGVMEEMSVHVEAMEAHQQSMVAYVNKLLTDVKNVKRRAVWQKIEYDKERQELVEELHTWKRRAEDLKATENDAVAAAEANAAYEAACLNQTIEQLQSEIVTLKTQLDETAEELARRGGTPEEAAETEQMLDALKELALDLKAQADEATAALEKQKAEAAEDMKQLQEIVSDLRQKSTKQTIAHDKERQELMEELHMWKNRALEAVTGARDITNSEADTTTASSISTDGDAEAHVVDNQISPIDEEATEASHVEDNQQDDQGVNQVDVMKSGSLDDPTSAAQETNQDETNNQTFEETVEASPSEDTADNGKPPVPSDNQDEDADAASNAKTFDDYAEGDSDTVPESPLHSPHRSDSFFTRVTRTFSFRSRTDSISSIPDYGTPSRTRADSIASSTTSAASTSRTKKASTPVLQHTRNDYLRQQEPFRMNSFKHFL